MGPPYKKISRRKQGSFVKGLFLESYHHHHFYVPSCGGKRIRCFILLSLFCLMTLVFVVNRSNSRPSSIPIYMKRELSNQIKAAVLSKDQLIPRKSSKAEHWSEIDTFPVSPFPNVKVFCWILTRKQNLPHKARYIRDTWARRCDKTLFFQSGASNASFPVIGLNVKQRKESKNNNIVKTIRAWRYIYRNYGQQYDFFIKTDDDVYLVVENLKLFLADKDPEANEFYAHKTLLGKGKEPFDQAGSGFILTRQSLRKLIQEVVIPQNVQCLLEDDYGDAEDWKIGFCLNLVSDAKAVDTVDSLGRERILIFRPGDMISDKIPTWFSEEYPEASKKYIKKGEKCCSFYPFAFHEIKGTYHFMMDYMLYNSRVSGDEYLIDTDLSDKITLVPPVRHALPRKKKVSSIKVAAPLAKPSPQRLSDEIYRIKPNMKKHNFKNKSVAQKGQGNDKKLTYLRHSHHRKPGILKGKRKETNRLEDIPQSSPAIERDTTVIFA